MFIWNAIVETVNDIIDIVKSFKSLEDLIEFEERNIFPSHCINIEYRCRDNSLCKRSLQEFIKHKHTWDEITLITFSYNEFDHIDYNLERNVIYLTGRDLFDMSVMQNIAVHLDKIDNHNDDNKYSVNINLSSSEED